MKLFYVANVRLPTEKAHGIQIMQMCKGFSLSDVKNIDVELVVPRRLNKIKQNPFDYFGIEKCFKITYLPCLDFLPWAKFLGQLSLSIQTVTFFISAFFYLLNKKFDIIYTRDEISLLFLPWRKKIIWETHNFSKIAGLLKKRVRKILAVVSLTSLLKKRLVEAGIPSDKILVAPDGVDLKLFSIDISQKEAREKTKLPLNKNIILYSGHFYKWKGVETLLLSAEFLPPNTEIILVGGSADEIKNLQLPKFNFFKVKFIGQRPHAEIPYWLKAADVLVLPNSGKEQISREFTSPLKLFEYMAAARPIVASRLPSVEEILQDQENAILFTPDDSQDLAEKIKSTLADTVLSEKISQAALAKVSDFSWDKRANKILSFYLDSLA